MLEYSEAIGGKYGLVAGCIGSHVHHDHINLSTTKEMLRRGVPVFVGEKVYDGLLKDGSINGVKPLPMAQKTFIGGFTVQPFEVAHNVPNYGFLIETPTKERIVFVTDAIRCNYKFRNINCIMVECNHDADTILDNLVENDVSMSHPENHMGLEDCIAFCKANTSIATKQIILIHLSSMNINEEYALKSVREAIPNVNVDVAHSHDLFKIESNIF